jgi:hypothetical protein
MVREELLNPHGPTHASFYLESCPCRWPRRSDRATYLFEPINFRILAVPSMGLDIFSDFFSRYGIKWFCPQIRLLKEIGSCPYSEPLSIVMEKVYHLGALLRRELRRWA